MLTTALTYLLAFGLVLHIDGGLDLCLQVADCGHRVVQHSLLVALLAQQELAASVQVLYGRPAQLKCTTHSNAVLNCVKAIQLDLWGS